MAVFLSHSPEETISWAKEYAKSLYPSDVVLLEGNMGAGKTVIAKGIAAGLGIKEEITSPTYAYVNSYQDRLFHFDCYRISSERQALELGLMDYLDAGGICLIEWGQNIAGLLPPCFKKITISGSGDEPREISYE